MPEIHGSNYLFMLFDDMGRINYKSPFSFADINEFGSNLSIWDKVTIKKMSSTYYHGLSAYVVDCDPPYMTENEREAVEDKKAKSVINSWKA